MNTLCYEEDSDVKDIERPNFDYQPDDLERNLRALWTSGGLGYIHERNRVQFHFILLLFCQTGARQGSIFKHGIPYKVNGKPVIIILNS